MTNIGFMWDTFLTLLSGVPLTLELAITSILAGSALALALSLLAVTGGAMGRSIAGAYVFVFRGSPLLVQMFLIYYGLGQFRHGLQDLGLWWFFREPYWCAVLALTLNTAAYCSEIFRGGLRAVSSQEIEAARACGMSGVLLFRRIILPIAIRHALPAYGNEIILMLKATALASVITIMEVTGLAGKLIADSFRAFEIFVVAGAIYLAINFVVTRILMLVEFWLSPHMRMRLQS
ncbi:ABC transporter permease subunit [Rhizobium leguminosarum]|uniref:ABC transporter permease n=1 Tax=Rhizobium TaxID=379 RepID=UPI001C974A0D|nr:ABC transporter permease subunit [Rhizobium leguminosarum]MBY5365775.1 ABC transporter permease subunit [Rhizobium leguminosarum]MBY5442349.1 ABC transporter permease subunit [Rhizobium leguminosarum]MBY5449138.1 ABC transporter permease subunit [Rhizobium leguminosarum]UWM77568.1 ABC transporter permease subunit [Rhizobium leguminosarum bv. viciae]